MSVDAATKKNRLIAFRVTEEEYAHIEKSALANGDEANTWCRNIIVAETREGFGLTKTERLIYKEIARVRYLVGNGFRLLIGTDGPDTATWKKVTAQADLRKELIADDLFSRYNPDNHKVEYSYLRRLETVSAAEVFYTRLDSGLSYFCSSFLA